MVIGLDFVKKMLKHVFRYGKLQKVFFGLDFIQNIEKVQKVFLDWIL